jgi:hypothetical protein
MSIEREWNIIETDIADWRSSEEDELETSQHFLNEYRFRGVIGEGSCH